MPGDAGSVPTGRQFARPGGPQSRPAVLRLIARVLERFCEVMFDDPALDPDTRRLIRLWCERGVELIDIITLEEQGRNLPHTVTPDTTSSSESSSDDSTTEDAGDIV